MRTPLRNALSRHVSLDVRIQQHAFPSGHSPSLILAPASPRVRKSKGFWKSRVCLLSPACIGTAIPLPEIRENKTHWGELGATLADLTTHSFRIRLRSLYGVQGPTFRPVLHETQETHGEVHLFRNERKSQRPDLKTALTNLSTQSSTRLRSFPWASRPTFRPHLAREV